MVISLDTDQSSPEPGQHSTIQIDEKSANPPLMPAEIEHLAWSQKWRRVSPYILTAFQSFMLLLVSGLNDGNLGIILPSIKAHYGVTQYVVSIIFLCNALGYIIGIYYIYHKPVQSISFDL